MNDISTIKDYHEASKHHFRRYARSLGYLDWANQPVPFREFIGAEQVALPVQETDESARYEDIFVPGKVAPQPLCLESISKFFAYSLAISAWKQAGDSRWALRVNPSSGNLHPTEGYCLLPAMGGMHTLPGVYHYSPKEHSLERRGKFPQAVWNSLGANIFLVGLSSIHWREAWKYGERAFRYCQHDCGHAYMALNIAARMLGWQVDLLDTVSDQEIAALFGLDRFDEFRPNEEEVPELLIAISPDPQKSPAPYPIPEEFCSGVAQGTWFGKANPLSRTHHPWPLIQVAEQASKKPRTTGEAMDAPGWANLAPDRKPATAQSPSDPSLRTYEQGLSAHQVITKRRSAVSMDRKTSLTRKAFYRMLLRIAESDQNLPWQANVHLALFVHRVDDLTPGLYLLVRHPGIHDALGKATHGHFLWQRPPECPDNLALYLLQEGDSIEIARVISCTQDIASDGAFSVGMIARFESRLDTYGAWFYKRLFWETGMIGQLLYLEAEAVGLSGTGIGCFFDDAVHDLLGLQGMEFQSLYHFTVGKAMVDPRLQ